MATHDQPIRLTHEQMRLLQEWSAQAGQSEQEWLAAALAGFEPRAESETFEAPVTFLDRLQQSGVLGALSGGPADLSTNGDHMRGFGK